MASLDTIWARIEQRGEFPILSRSVHAAVAAMTDEASDSNGLANIVLSDFALTQRVLRLANSAMYVAFGGNITTVSRALTILGMQAVGHLALGMKLLDHFQDVAGHRAGACLEFKRALLAGAVARELAGAADQAATEEAFICTLMHEVGRLLVACYLEQDWAAIQLRTERDGQNECAACVEILGVTFDQLGQEAAARWNLPALIRAGMREPDGQAERDERNEAEGRGRAGEVGGAGEVGEADQADRLDRADRADQADRDDRADRSAISARQPGSALASSATADGPQVTWLQAVTAYATRTSRVMTDGRRTQAERAARLLEIATAYAPALAVVPERLAALASGLIASVEGHELIGEINALRVASEASAARAVDPVTRFRVGLEELRDMASTAPLPRILAAACETVLASHGFRRAIYFERHAQKAEFMASQGAGHETSTLRSVLRFPGAAGDGVFGLAVKNGVGVLIGDATDAKLAGHLPAWVTGTLPAVRGFVLLPVKAHTVTVGMMYADWAAGDTIRPVDGAAMAALNRLSVELARCVEAGRQRAVHAVPANVSK